MMVTVLIGRLNTVPRQRIEFAVCGYRRDDTNGTEPINTTVLRRRGRCRLQMPMPRRPVRGTDK